ncbi:hypothetical protein QSV08_03295 [Maribacter sp. BPC-D8]|uniref:hypothetical protein n=1 Tax=Maribacter sp. BPC-D8 TaxID=3053613 RepID=UPI002B49D73F|nr:hypothetical protein [Maribacter sp. BPC-D8]WRI30269.1 hypothetical protein QSV08_03295 [Maribacter sp. BPC-D8]
MKHLSIIFILTISFFKSFGQGARDIELVDILNKYESIEKTNQYDSIEKAKDSLWKIFTNKLETTIQDKNIDLSKFGNLKKKCDSTVFRFDIYYSEDRKLTLYHFANGFIHLNYLTQQTHNNSPKIILKDNRLHQYFTEVHNLNNDEFLLIERQDDMSFSCYYASVYKLNNKNRDPIKKEAFENERKLTVCSWTNVDDSNPIIKSDSGTIKSRLKSYEPNKLVFDFKMKSLSYSYNRVKDGKLKKRKSKYRNGKFKIQNYDVREFIE